ncbi:MAG TPA: hypothetical protein PKA90_03905, partial [Ignavibacteria bacterium]|nr:hypothetical protein [Ignavibacteria bacterium]
MKKSNYFFHFFTFLSFLIFSGNLLAQSDIAPLERKLKGPVLNTSSEVRTPDNNSDAIIINVPGSYSTIQAAINAANNGDIILVAAGVYRENLTINKYIQLRGSNYTVNPNTGIRGPETVIQPGTSDPDPNSLTAVNILYITPGGSGSVIDGFTFDGDNTTITSGVVMNGADVDAVEAISAYDGLSNTTISNNIIKNLNYAGIDLYNYTNGGASTYDNIVTNNKFDNIIPASYGIGVLIYNNCYTSVTYNVMTRVRIGVQTGNYYNADLGSNHTISHNDIECSRLGIFHNLAYSNATTYTLDSNNITTVAGSLNNNGILVSSFQGAAAVNMNDNNVSDARIGFNLWNCPTTSTVTVNGGTASNCNIGVFANNFDGYSSNATTSSYAMTGVTLSGCDTSIWIRDNDLNTNSSTVTLNINNSSNFVNGTGMGLLIEGSDAFVLFNGAVPVDFSASLSKYIRLATNGSSVPSSLINAQNVYFGGTDGSSMTNVQLFSTEDKIDHRIDWSDLGFVSVKSNNNFVTVNSYYTPNTTSARIQRGVDVAVPGDTVNAGPGNFTEQLEINKALVLDGQGSGTTNLISPDTLLLSYTTSAVNKPVIYVHDASDVIIKNMTIDGAGKGNLNYRFQGIGYRNAGGTVRDCEVKSIRNTPINGAQGGVGIFAQADDGNPRTLDIINNDIFDFQKNATSFSGADLIANVDSNSVTGAGPVSFIAQNGIQIGFGAGGSVTNNTISNISYVPSTVVSCGVLLYQPSGTVTTSKNTLTACQMSIYYIDVGGDISENTINSTLANTGTALYWGIDADPGDRPRVDPQPFDDEDLSLRKNSSARNNANAITTSIFRNVLTSDGTNGTGIEMDALGTETLNATATENKVNGWDAGVVFYKDAGATLNGIVNDNDLSGNTYSVYDLTGVTQNATCNWFGTTDVPTILTGISGAVHFIPFGTDGTDNDLVAPGFQPVPGSCNGVGPVKNITQNLTYVAIQPAINASNNGDTLEVSPGTYNEQVLVNKGLVIKGVG